MTVITHERKAAKRLRDKQQHSKDLCQILDGQPPKTAERSYVGAVTRGTSMKARLSTESTLGICVKVIAAMAPTDLLELERSNRDANKKLNKAEARKHTTEIWQRRWEESTKI